MAKLTKAQRLKLVSDEDRAKIEVMSDDYLLAIHDLLHAQMERRHGSNKRAVAGAALEAENGR